MAQLDTIMAYFSAFVAGDSARGAACFTEDASIDDALGAHHQGQGEIKALIEGRAPGLTIDAPLHVIDVPGRVVVFGKLYVKNLDVEMRVRWCFHFDGELISHLCNSNVRKLYGVEFTGGKLPTTEN